jgi:hypothetical protein
MALVEQSLSESNPAAQVVAVEPKPLKERKPSLILDLIRSCKGEIALTLPLVVPLFVFGGHYGISRVISLLNPAIKTENLQKVTPQFLASTPIGDVYQTRVTAVPSNPTPNILSAINTRISQPVRNQPPPGIAPTFTARSTYNP